MNHKSTIALQVCEALKESASDDPELDEKIVIYQHEGTDEYVDVDYDGLQYRIEIRGPF